MTVMISGGFDPLHVGHLDLIERARRHGPVVVALNSDDWLIRKKGFCLMPWEDRARILNALSAVSDVIRVKDADGTVSDALSRVRPKIFANGGDQTEADRSEHLVCIAFGIREMFGVGGPKVRSSSKLVAAAG